MREAYYLEKLIGREDALAQFLSARGASRRFYERSQEHGPLEHYGLCRILCMSDMHVGVLVTCQSLC
jgi:hypothetical protein